MDWDDLKVPLAVVGAALLCLVGILFATTVDPVGLRLVIVTVSISVSVVPFWLAARAGTEVIPSKSWFNPSALLMMGFLCGAISFYAAVGPRAYAACGGFFMGALVLILGWDVSRRRPR